MTVTPCYNGFLESVVSLCSNDTAPPCHSRTALLAVAIFRNETVAQLERWRLQGSGGDLCTHLVGSRELDARDVSLLLLSLLGLHLEVTGPGNVQQSSCFSRRQAGRAGAILGEKNQPYTLAFSWPQRGHSPNSITN